MVAICSLKSQVKDLGQRTSTQEDANMLKKDLEIEVARLSEALQEKERQYTENLKALDDRNGEIGTLSYNLEREREINKSLSSQLDGEKERNKELREQLSDKSGELTKEHIRRSVAEELVDRLSFIAKIQASLVEIDL